MAENSWHRVQKKLVLPYYVTVTHVQLEHKWNSIRRSGAFLKVVRQVKGLGMEVPQSVHRPGPKPKQGSGGSPHQKIKIFVTDTLNFKGNCKEIRNMKLGLQHILLLSF